MNSVLSVNNKGSPARFFDDSGYGSVQGTHHGQSLRNPSNSGFSFTCAAQSEYTGAIKRPKLSSLETIKKRLFGTPPSSGRKSWLDSQLSMSVLSPAQRKKQLMITKLSGDLENFKISGKEGFQKELSYKAPPSTPVKFFYSPLKNSLLFPVPTPSPPKSLVPAIVPSEATNDEGWRVSFNLPENRCNVLQKLSDSYITSGVSTILSYLSEKDLYRASCVSRGWRQIVLMDVKARRKRASYMLKRSTFKENQKGIVSQEDALRRNTTGSDRELLLDVTNKDVFKQSVTSNIPVAKSDFFIEVANSISKTEVILKCPMCQYPAKCQVGNRYGCTRDLCNYVFCRKCLGSHVHSHKCRPLLTIPNVIIGSKRSKKNLRRL